MRVLFCLNKVYNLFYKNNKKYILLELFDLIDVVVLVYWIMGDGYLYNNSVVLCIDLYILEECIYLMNILIIKFNLDVILFIYGVGKIGNIRYRIFIRIWFFNNFRNIVLFYFDKSMLYKL